MTEFQHLNRLPSGVLINVVSFLHHCVLRIGKLIGRIMLNDPRYEIQIKIPEQLICYNYAIKRFNSYVKFNKKIILYVIVYADKNKSFIINKYYINNPKKHLYCTKYYKNNNYFNHCTQITFVSEDYINYLKTFDGRYELSPGDISYT